MYCQSCKNCILDTCKKFGSFKPDSQLRLENFGCFDQRIHKVNRSLKNFTVDENIYLDEMDSGEIQAAIRYGNVVKKMIKARIN